MRRFTRLANGFSKKLDSLKGAVALHFAHYNLVRIHRTPARRACYGGGCREQALDASRIGRRDEQVTDHPRPKGRIYMYPMGGRGGGLSRFTNGTVEDLKQEGIVPVEGIRLKFYCDDGNDKGEADYLLFDGQITFKDGE